MTRFKVTVTCMAGPDTRTIARKIRALLDQAESTPYAAEAEAATAKATELMAKYRISQAMVSDTEDIPDTIGVRTFQLRRGPYVTVRSRLLFRIAEAFGCESVYRTNWDGRSIDVLGFASDLDAVDMLFTSLMLQADTAVRASAVPAGQKAVAWRRGFLHGFASEVGDRLEAQMRAAVAAETERRNDNDRTASAGATNNGATADKPASSVALVLAERGAQVASEYKRRWPRVVSDRPAAAVGGAATSAGRAAGRTAQLTTSAGVARGAKAQLN